MNKRVLHLTAALSGIVLLLQSPTAAKERTYPIRYSGWRTEFKTDGVGDGVFARQLRMRTEKRTLRQTRTSDTFPYYVYQETYTIQFVVVTNVSRAPLYYHASGPDAKGVCHPFDYYEELQNGVWVATDSPDCASGVWEHELKPGRSAKFYRGTFTPGVNKVGPRKRQWIILADRPFERVKKGYRTRSLTLLSDSAVQ